MDFLWRCFVCVAVGLALVLAARLFGAEPKPQSEPKAVAIKEASRIGDGTVRFTPVGWDESKTPSLAFANPLPDMGTLGNWKIKPQFYLRDGKAGAAVAVPEGTSLYGTGEVTGPLLRNGKKVELWNTDNVQYERAGGVRLYQSHPWVLGVRPDGSAFGVIFDTTWKGELETGDIGTGGIGTGGKWIVCNTEGSTPFRVVIIDRESPEAVMRELAELTGKMPLPPLWALGFHQCRWSYYPDAKVREIADGFRKRSLPCDVIWLDIHYMDGYRVFTFDPARFPDPAATNDYLHKNGFHSVWMIDPGVKAEVGYTVFDTGSKGGVWVRAKDGSDFRGNVWPGACVFPDFTMPAARKWWGGQYADFLAKGIDGVWNDMNEPSVFDGPDWTMPGDNIHRGGGGLPEGPHTMYHNVYGMLMVMATRQGILDARPGKRPFVLSRANYLGGQRYAATWTGDNDASMPYLEMSIPMSLTLGLSGQPFNGPDVGGFNGAITPELYGKWIAMGPFYPFFRAHTSADNPPREPWAFGPEIEGVARTALERRYRMLPYIYTQMREASETGMPMMRPVFFADPRDAALRAEDRAFLFGPDLLVAPRWANDVKLPKGTWRDVSLVDEKREADGYQPAVKIRGGAIVPLGRVVQSTNENSLDPLTLLVCPDESGRAQGLLYEDDGDGFGYMKGDYALTRYDAVVKGDAVVVTIGERTGERKIAERKIVVRVIGAGGVYEGSGEEGKGVTVEE